MNNLIDDLVKEISNETLKIMKELCLKHNANPIQHTLIIKGDEIEMEVRDYKSLSIIEKIKLLFWKIFKQNKLHKKLKNI